MVACFSKFLILGGFSLSDCFRFTQGPLNPFRSMLQVVLAAVRQNGNAFKPLWHLIRLDPFSVDLQTLEFKMFIMYSVAPQLDEEKKYEAGPQPFVAMALCMFEVQN